MFQEAIDNVEVGKTLSRRNEQASHADDPVCFSIAILLVLLYKYASRLDDYVHLKILFNHKNNLELDFQYSISANQSFNSVFMDVKAYLESSILKTGELDTDLTIDWLRDEQKMDSDYRIHLTFNTTTHLPEASFSSNPSSFFHYLFQKAARHYEIVSVNSLDKPGDPIDSIDYISKKDFHDIETVAYGPVDESASELEFLDKLFDQSADKFAHSVAVISGKKSCTYATLKRNADRLANLLIQKGIKPGEKVAILLDRSVEAYISMLGILKCGAVYVPIDTDYPAERVEYILVDSSAKCLISKKTSKNVYTSFTGITLPVETDLSAVFNDSVKSLEKPVEVIRSIDSSAYIIYTSGSTGKPKGVVISHAAASNLVKAEKYKFKLKEKDRVAQGFSIAFDASMEEIWLAFASGASLYPIDKEIICSGSDLCKFINRQKITVFSTVPTLLSMMPLRLPSLRLLILGGESCPHELLQRWHRNQLRIVNTYGPTEATVIATLAEFNPQEKITIGKPIANYGVFITNESVKPVPVGVPGELCIAGYGLATEYHNNPALTSQKFITPSFTINHNFPRRIYRSGDLARFNQYGEIEFLGRVDTQVKLRGYRIELSEIESQLLQIRNVKSAVVLYKEDPLRGAYLIAYVVPEKKSVLINEVSIKNALRKKLAVFMIPSAVVAIDELPLLPSGKVDKKKLPDPPRQSRKSIGDGERPVNGMEERILQVWTKYFSSKSVSLTDDFFTDLGGHSLLAAKTVSELRLHQGFHDLSVVDVYKNPTIKKLARLLVDRQVNPHQKSKRDGSTITNSHFIPSKSKHFIAGVLQFCSLYLVWGFNLIRDFSLCAVFFYLYYGGHTLEFSLVRALAASIISYPLLISMAIIMKWILLGRVRPGRHKLWGSFYLRWWFVRKLFQLLDLYHLAGTPLLPMVYRFLGMKIGRDVHLETGRFAAFDVVSIGDGTSVDEDACLNGFSVQGGYLNIGYITIGSKCFIGARSMVCEHTVMQNGARLENLSLLPSGSMIPAGETWAGAPAKCVDVVNPSSVIQPPKRNFFQKTLIAFSYSILVCVIPIVSAIAFLPGVMVLMQFHLFAEPLRYLSILPLVGLSFVVLLTTQVVVLKWILVGRVKPGIYPVHGWFYFRNWIVDQLLRISLDHVGQLHATLYVATWYRALGMKIGRFVELSTACSSTPDLIHLSEGCTIADEVSLGSPHIERGWMTVTSVRLGYRTFVGNSAVIPAGTRMGRNSLIGVLSIAPHREAGARSDATWFGSPAILFPKRELSKEYKEEKTYQPSRRLRVARATFELLRVTLPPAAFIVVAASVITLGLNLWTSLGIVKTLFLLPIVFGLSSGLMILAVALLKWLVVGRYKPFARVLWSNFVWRLELVNALYEFFASPLLLAMLQGTPFLPWYLRLMGAKVGSQCYFDTTGFLEWDLVEIGDRVMVNENAVLQTHLFEDRVLKASQLRVGADCMIGPASVVLYDSLMHDESKLDALSLLMKGETLPEKSHWIGIPAMHKNTISPDNAIDKRTIELKANGYPHRSTSKAR